MDPSRARIRRISSVLELAERAPAAGLGAGLAPYGGKRERDIPERIYPASTLVAMTLSFGAPAYLRSGSDHKRGRRYVEGHVSGLSDDYTVVTAAKAHRERIVVQLAPQAARRLFGVAMDELAHTRVSLEALFGREGRALYARCGEATSWDERFDAIDDFLTARIPSSPPTPVERAVAEIVTRLSSHPSQSIAELATDLGWSHPLLITRFKDQVGVSPRRFARIARFERLFGQLSASPQESFASVAARCGYYDQAHLAREARALAGTTLTRVTEDVGRDFHDARVVALF